jgi:hypothetical protein
VEVASPQPSEEPLGQPRTPAPQSQRRKPPALTTNTITHLPRMLTRAVFDTVFPVIRVRTPGQVLVLLFWLWGEELPGPPCTVNNRT